MKSHLLKIGSLFMAFMVLFVSVGWDVKFHYCTEEHRMTSRLSSTEESCPHCYDHRHNHDAAHVILPEVIHFESKCCCEDFDSIIQFTDNFVFSPEKHLFIHFQPIAFIQFVPLDMTPKVQGVFHHITEWKLPYFRSAKDMLVFFSALRLNPLVF